MSIGKKKASSSSASSKAKNGSSSAKSSMKKTNKSKGASTSSLKKGKSKSSDDAAILSAKSARKKNGSKVLMDKKGKKPLKEFVDLPGVSNDNAQDEDSQDSEDEDEDDDQAAAQAAKYVQDMLGNDSDDDDEERGPALGNADFLTRMKAKDLAKSRAYLLEEHRRSKPAPLTKAEQQAKASTSTSSSRVPLPKIAPAKVDVNSDDEENLNALSDDDFANMGSGSEGEDSDDLSVMSEFLNGKDRGQEDFDDGEDDFSDSEFDSELDDDDDDLGEEEDEEEAWGGIDEEASTSSSTNTVISANPEALEDQYGALQAKRAKREAELESKKRKRLPTFGDKAALSGSDMESSASDSDDDDQDAVQEAIANKQKKNKKNRIRHASVASSSESESEKARQTEYAKRSAAVVKSNPYGARFGRPSIASILSLSNMTERLQLAREEIASLGREITGEPELGMNLLKRLLSFANKEFLSPDGETFVIDIPVRVWAMGSALAVFIDILPGYRIRALTDQEKNQKTTQAVIQQREYEDSLVGSYKRFIDLCELQIKSSSSSSASTASQAEKVLESVAVRCMCELAKGKNYFNFATQVLENVVRRAANKVFDESSELCLSSLSTILSDDSVGDTSLDVVRLLSRIIKARSYLVHPSVLSVLLSLRVADLRGVRAGRDRLDKSALQQKHRAKDYYNQHKDNKSKKGGPEKPFLNKKARKAIKEKREIEAEIAEAENVVKDQERSHNSTETLKLLFALYFRILKLPAEQNSKLLPAALEGLARFSTLINVDFFRDILGTLKDVMGTTKDVRIQLLCIEAALELLSGQGEALNIDLTAFITHLYALLVPLTYSITFEDVPANSSTIKRKSAFSKHSPSALLFMALERIFITSRMPNPPIRSLAFSKRILMSALHWPRASALNAIEFVTALIVKEPRLASMLNTEDRKRDGVYRYEIDDEGLSNIESTVWWELALLEREHYDEQVRAAAARLARSTKDD